MRILRRLVLALFSGLFLLLLTLLLIAMVLTTPPGTRLAVMTALELAAPEVTVRDVSGSLLDAVQLHGVEYRDPASGATVARIDRVLLDWQPMLLLRDRLAIQRLEVDKPELWLPASQQGETAPPTIVAPPLPIHIDQLSVRDLVVHQKDSRTGPIQLAMQAHSEGDAVVIEQARLSTPDAKLQLHGRLTLTQQLPFSTELQWQVQGTDGQSLRGGGTLQGDLQQVNFHQATQMPEGLLLAGRVDLASATPQLTLDASWKTLRWPPTAATPWQSDAGNLQLNGSPNDYRFDLRTDLRGAGVPASQIQAQGHGGEKGLHIDTLHVETLGGSVQGKGDVAWQPSLAIDAKLQASDIDPAKHWPDWPGKLNFGADLAIGRKAGELSGRYRLSDLKGRLRDQALSGSALVQQQGGVLRLQSAQLQAGGGRVQAQGQLAPDTQLDASWHIPRLQHWLENAAGSLDGTARLSGTSTAPQVELQTTFVADQAASGDERLAAGLPRKIALQAQGSAQLNGQANSAKLTLALSTPGEKRNRLEGQFGLTQSGKATWPQQAALDGSLRGHLQGGPLLTRWLPDMPADGAGIDVDLGLGGNLAQPTVHGSLKVREPKVLIPQLGIALTDLQLQLQGSGGPDLAVTGSVRSGKGQLSVRGRVTPDAQRGWPVHLTVSGDKFLAAKLPEATVLVSPDLTLDNHTGRLTVRGTLGIPQAKLAPPKLAASAVTVSDDVVVAGSKAEPAPRFNGAVDADLQLEIGQPDRTTPLACIDPSLPTPSDCPGLTFNGFGLHALLAGRLRLHETHTEPKVDGRLKMLGGNFEGMGTSLLLKNGYLLFSGPPTDPRVQLTAQRVVDNVTVGVKLSGDLRQPQSQLFSDPTMDNNQILSYLLLGRPLQSESTSPSNGALRSAGLALGGGLLGDALGKQLGLDVDVSSGQNGANVALGKYLSSRFYLGYGLDLFDRSPVLRAVYRLSRHLSLQAQGGIRSGVDIDYRTQWD